MAGRDAGRRTGVFDCFALPGQRRRVDARRVAAQRRQAVHPGARQPHGGLFSDPPALAQVMRDWHANVGKAIVENWGFPEHIAEAIGEHENIDRMTGHADVTDVLTVAVMAAGFMGHEVDFELNMQGVKAFRRLSLDNAKCAHIMRSCSDEIAALRTALGD